MGLVADPVYVSINASAFHSLHIAQDVLSWVPPSYVSGEYVQVLWEKMVLGDDNASVAESTF